MCESTDASGWLVAGWLRGWDLRGCVLVLSSMLWLATFTPL